MNIFSKDQFKTTQFWTAAQKADYANRLVRFMQGGFRPGEFGNLLFKCLLASFGFTSNQTQAEFYAVWFADGTKRRAFVQHILQYVPKGSPDQTFSDVEKLVQEWLRTSSVETDIIAAEKVAIARGHLVGAVRFLVNFVPDPSMENVQPLVRWMADAIKPYFAASDDLIAAVAAEVVSQLSK